MAQFDSKRARGQFLEFEHPGGTIRVHYHEAGSGDRHVMLVQSGGAGTSAYMSWFPNIDAFAAAGYHVHAPDMIGFAQSEVVGKPGERINSSEFLVGFMDARGIPSAHYMGNSMGSNAITRLAVDAPQRVRSLIVTGGEPRIETEESRAISRELGKTPRTDFVREMFSKPEVSFEDMRHATADFFYDRDHPAIEPIARSRLAMVTRPGVQERERAAAFRQIEGGRDTFGSSNLARIQAPTYLVHGRDEPHFYPAEVAPALVEAAFRVCQVIPDCSCTVLSYCGHWPQIERAETFNALALQFIGSVR